MSEQESRREFVGDRSEPVATRTSAAINADLRKLLSELWDDCYRNHQPTTTRRRMFDERLLSLVHDAITETN